MKTFRLGTTIFTLILLSLFVGDISAQSPPGINYQAVARDATGNLMTNQNIDVKFIIKETAAGGPSVYEESHAVTTNQYGLFSLVIGDGVVLSGAFNAIDWGADDHFLRVDIDNGGGFVNLGTKQLQSVPYSIYSEKSGVAENMSIDDLTDVSTPTATVDDILKYDGSNWTLSTDNVNDGDIDSMNEFQDLTLAADMLSISNGNAVDLSEYNNVWSDSAATAYYDIGPVGIGVGPDPVTGFHVAGNTRVLFGTDTLGAGDKLMWLPDLHAFRVGTVASGAASVYWNRDSIGRYSFASGYNTRAQGFGATAMGRDTEASNSYAFASGFFTNADGQYSTAMGFNTDAMALGSTALGYGTDAEQSYSTALGYISEAQGVYSTAIGHSVRAQSYASVAVGRYNIGGGNATSWISSDPIFEIGIGTGPSTRANAITVRKNGNVGVGTTFPGARLHVANGALRIGSLEEITDGGSFILQVNSSFAPLTNGNRTLGNATFRWSTVYATNGTINTSDSRDKNSVNDIEYGIEEVMKLRPVSYKWNEHPEQGVKLGLIAQELQEVISEVVVDKEFVVNEASGELEIKSAERLGVYYSDLIPVLIKAIQDQQELIEQQEERISSLENRGE